MKINPTDKVQDLIVRFRKYEPAVRKKRDNGYEWMKEADACVEILNRDPDARIKSLIIHCEDEVEFTLYFDGHTHFCADEDDYERMCKLALDILNNEYCSELVFGGEEKKWLCFSFKRREDVEHTLWERIGNMSEEEIDSMDLYKYVKDVFKKLKTYGGEVQYVFWNATYNRTIKIDKKIDV